MPKRTRINRSFHVTEVTGKPKLSEADAEAMADRIIWRRLRADRRYLNAENAQEQSIAETQIEVEVWEDIRDRYEVQ